MGSTLTNLIYHVIFSTKDREPAIIPEIRDELHRYLGGIVKGEGGVLLQIGGMADHIHMVIKLKPIYALSEIMKKVKGSSSKWINEQNRLMDRFSWQEGYGAFTVSESQTAAVIRYVGDQENHHRTLSFKEEFVLILKRHEVEYDARYLWT
jgi:REP element-mobilizing transposase RayT